MFNYPVSGPGGVTDRNLPKGGPVTNHKPDERITPKREDTHDKPGMPAFSADAIKVELPSNQRKHKIMKETFPKAGDGVKAYEGKMNEKGTKTQFYNAGLLAYPGEDAPGKMGNL